jgi:hypothetical protein
MEPLPPPITALVDELAAMPGVVAVALGGSRVAGPVGADTDWDLGVYYRGDVDLTALARRGAVHAPGTWGRIMNGGAWIRAGDARVDVLLRDLDVVEHWTRRAAAGAFEVDALLGYLAGAPTYMLTAELASCRVLRGALPAVDYPEALAALGPPRWRFCRDFSLAYARTLAARGHRVGALGQTARAVLEEAQAVACARRTWVCNEKRLVDAAGLADVEGLVTQVPVAPAALAAWIDAVAARLGAAPGATAPWDAARSGG